MLFLIAKNLVKVPLLTFEKFVDKLNARFNKIKDMNENQVKIFKLKTFLKKKETHISYNQEETFVPLSDLNKIFQKGLYYEVQTETIASISLSNFQDLLNWKNSELKLVRQEMVKIQKHSTALEKCQEAVIANKQGTITHLEKKNASLMAENEILSSQLKDMEETMKTNERNFNIKLDEMNNIIQKSVEKCTNKDSQITRALKEKLSQLQKECCAVIEKEINELTSSSSSSNQLLPFFSPSSTMNPSITPQKLTLKRQIFPLSEYDSMIPETKKFQPSSYWYSRKENSSDACMEIVSSTSNNNENVKEDQVVTDDVKLRLVNSFTVDQATFDNQLANPDEFIIDIDTAET